MTGRRRFTLLHAVLAAPLLALAAVGAWVLLHRPGAPATEPTRREISATDAGSPERSEARGGARPASVEHLGRPRTR